jgi:trimeric autotransporter adhesin
MSASVLRYRKLVTTDLANQAVNLAESGTMGHRVQIPMSVDDMNSFFVWDRPAGSDRAVGHFVASTAANLKFDDMMIASLSRVYTDVDGVTNGLNYSSAVLDANTDGRVRKDGNVSANDIVMAYLLYKCYGSSAAPTASIIYNLEDAHQMLSNGGLTLAIHNSLAAEEALSTSAGVDKGAVDAMFRDLLAADPMRFFDATGKQIAGLFETNADSDSTGTWGFVENDKIEMRVQFNFTNAVTRRGVQDPTQAIAGAANAEDVDTIVIPAGSKFIIRLQIVATDTPSGAAAKATASANAISSALAAQVASTKKAADNAAAAQRMATDAMNAAAAQTAAANARYQKAVNDAAAQATAVSNAQAALQAAQAALSQAIATGSTQSDIQNQRAAAVAAAAAAQNAQAIATAAQADIQNAKNAQDAAAAALAAAQTATAAAASNVAKANAAAAAASLAASNDASVKASNAKAASDAASDPLTKTLTDAEKKILDPQTLITAAAAVNAKTDSRVAAKIASDGAQATADLAAQKQAGAAKALADAIAEGQTLTTIQMLRAAAVTSVRDKANADAIAAANLQNFLNAARDELAAQQLSAKASSDAAVLNESIARADVNVKERARVAADSANTAAQSANTAAQAAATNAQNSLDAAIAAGAVFVELQTKRAAALDTRTAANAAKDAADKAAAALADAVAQKTIAVNTASAAEQTRLDDISASASKAALINNATAASNNYQASKVYLANANARAQAFNEAQMIKNDAKQSLDVAAAAYVIARDSLDAAVTAGKTVPEIVALRTQAQAAADKQTQAQAIFNAASTAFNGAQAALMKGVMLDASGNPRVDTSGNLLLNTTGPAIWDASANAILTLAAQNNLTSITNAEANSLVLNYLSAQATADLAESAAVKAHNVSEIAKKALENGITGGLTINQITALRSEAVDAASKDAKAQAAANAAKAAALNSLGRVFTPGPTYASAVAILNSMRILQGQADNAARNNEMAAALNAAYAKDTDAQKALVTAQYAQYVADKELNDAVVGGATLDTIRGLQATAAASAKLTADSRQKADFSASALAQQITWSTLNYSIDDAGAQISSNYTTDASGVAVLTASKAAAAAAAEAARCNSLVRQYMLLLSKADEATTSTYKAQADVDTASAALNTAITQGSDLAAIQALRAEVQAVSNTLAALKAAENLANAARDSSKAALLARDPSGNYINAGAKAILDAAVVSQKTAVDRAAANSQVDAYTAAFARYQHTLSELSAATSAAQLASKALDTAITAGADVTAIQGLRLTLEQARGVQSVAQTAKDNANAAQNQLRIAIETGTRDASGVLLPKAQIAMNLLIQAQLAQEAAVASSESNARARMFFKAKDDEAKANVILANTQAAYDTAARLLDQAITGGATIAEIQTLRATAQTAGDVVSSAQSTAAAAAAASAIAKQAVTADPNALAILNDLQLYQANKASLAKANSLMDAWNAAVAAEAAAQENYDLSALAQSIAAKALDTAIGNGAGITEIQSLRDTSVAATTNASTAMATLNLKKAAALKSRTDAAADPLATVILDASAQFDKIAVARTTVNSALLTLNAAQAALTAANAQAASDNAASTLANNTLSYAILPYDASGNNITASPLGGKTVQEIVDLRANATRLAQVAAASKNSADSLAADVINKQAVKTAADAALAAIPWPQLPSTQSYTMTTVSLNETKLVKDASGQHIYIDSSVMVRALQGATIGTISYTPVDLSGVQILGLGVTSTPTKITKAQVVASLPTGLYPTSVKLTVDKDVVLGDGNFYLVGGEILLNDYIM